MCAGVFWWKSARSIADAISWSILLGSGTPMSLTEIKRLSTLLNPDVRAGPGPVGAL